MAQPNAPNGEILPKEVHVNVNHLNTLLADSMSNKIHELTGQPGHSEPLTIFRVPIHIRTERRELYEPQIISIGPYHRRTKSLEAMEEQKWRSLRELLSRQQADRRLIDLVKKVRSLEYKARASYKENVCLNSDEFVEMIILDGCFIIHFLSSSDHGKVDSGISIKNSDLLLLENQIPFFILRELYFIIFPNYNDRDLYFLLANFMLNAANVSELQVPTECPVHLVHLYYYWLLLKQDPRTGRQMRCHFQFLSPLCHWFAEVIKNSVLSSEKLRSTKIPSMKLTTRAPIKVIPSATALKEAGVKFKRKISSLDLFHVTFNEGVMEISSIILDNTRKRLFLNLIALEQNETKWEKDLTSFAKLMDMLIDTPKDVAILEKAGILHNLLASAEEAACFFNQICECATVDYNNNYLAEVIKDVRQYCDSSWHKHRARLMRDYFNNPWSIISLIAGIILLILSFLQVYFTVNPPKHPYNSS